jgi:hypothetical protein
MVRSKLSEIIAVVQSLAHDLSNGTVESASLPTSFAAVLKNYTSYLVLAPPMSQMKTSTPFPRL